MVKAMATKLSTQVKPSIAILSRLEGFLIMFNISKCKDGRWGDYTQRRKNYRDGMSEQPDSF